MLEFIQFKMCRESFYYYDCDERIVATSCVCVCFFLFNFLLIVGLIEFF